MGTYLVWVPDRGATRDDARRVQGLDPEDAAVRWARWDDANSADYTIVGGQPVEVMVAEDVAGSVPQRLAVHGEPCPHYWTRRA